MTLSDITYNLLNIIRGGEISDDEAISDRQVEFIVNYYRALLIKKEIETKNSISHDWIQDLGCIELAEVDKAECCDLTWGCKVKRSIDKIPNAIATSTGNTYTFVGLIDKVTSIALLEKTQAVRRQYSKYTSTVRVAYIHNNYLYILNDGEIDFVNIQGVFEDPREAGRFSDCDGSKCYTPNSDYPISSSMVSLINNMVIKGELKVMGYAPTDQYNDATNNITPIVKP
jgi:hypothetical protein